MDEKLEQAYNSLIPADQTIVDCLIYTLANKDKQIVGLAAELNKRLTIDYKAEKDDSDSKR